MLETFQPKLHPKLHPFEDISPISLITHTTATSFTVCRHAARPRPLQDRPEELAKEKLVMPHPSLITGTMPGRDLCQGVWLMGETSTPTLSLVRSSWKRTSANLSDCGVELVWCAQRRSCTSQTRVASQP